MPRILLCSPTPLDARLGASKVYIEVAEAFRRIGWDSTVIGPDYFKTPAHSREYTAALNEHLRHHAGEFDVVEVEHTHFPLPRSEWAAGTLVAVRSVLLTHAVCVASIPGMPTWRGRIAKIVKGYGRRRQQRLTLERCNAAMRAADRVNVSNFDDRDLLTRAGHASAKVAVFPFGLFPERLAEFVPTPTLPAAPRIAFVGTFDPRKGLVEFPKIVRELVRQFPAASFRLVGTAGLLATAKGVLRFFPPSLHIHLDIVPRYNPAELPRLLADCSLGVFPSYVEGFGFGVLEMLAAGLPVVAYRVPGPPMMLPAEYLAERGDWPDLVRRVRGLLAEPARLQRARDWARSRAGDFRWEQIARDTAADYLKAIEQLRRGKQ